MYVISLFLYKRANKYRSAAELRIFISTCSSNSFSKSCRDFFSDSILLLSSSISAVVSVILSGTFPFWNHIVTQWRIQSRRRRRWRQWRRRWQFYTSFVSLTSMPSSFFSCLFSSWSDRMLFLAMERSSFMRAFVVVRDSTFAWRFVTVALKLSGNVTKDQARWNAGREYLLQMSVQLLDVILLIEHRGHIVVLQLVVRRLAGYVIAVAQIKREIDHTLLTVEIFLLSQHATIGLVITSSAQI